MSDAEYRSRGHPGNSPPASEAFNLRLLSQAQILALGRAIHAGSEQAYRRTQADRDHPRHAASSNVYVMFHDCLRNHLARDPEPGLAFYLGTIAARDFTETRIMVDCTDAFFYLPSDGRPARSMLDVSGVDRVVSALIEVELRTPNSEDAYLMRHKLTDAGAFTAEQVQQFRALLEE